MLRAVEKGRQARATEVGNYSILLVVRPSTLYLNLVVFRMAL
jgi:hypothetical protein